MAEQETKRFLCVQKRHWIPKDLPGKSRRRWSVGMIYEGTDTPPKDHFKEIDSADLAAKESAEKMKTFMQPQTLQEQQILEMANVGAVAAWIKKNYPAEAEELGVSDKMKRADANELAFKLLRGVKE